MATAVVDAAQVRGFRDLLLATVLPGSPVGMTALLTALQELACAVVAVTGDLALRLDGQIRADEAAAGVPEAKQGVGVARQVGLAVHRSPHAGRTLLGVARVLDVEMPHTRARLRDGTLDEAKAVVLVRETACLPLDARQQVDVELCADPVTLDGVGTRRLTGLVRAAAARLDLAAVVERHRRAAAGRGVWVRPAPDGMCHLTAALPLAQGIAAYAALRRAADGEQAADGGRVGGTAWDPGTGQAANLATDPGTGAADTAGDPGIDPYTGGVRGRGAIMADTLVERLTGQATAETVPVTVHLVISDQTLLGAGHEPATILDDAGAGYGTVPAQVARTLIAAGLDARAVWLRRLYATPGGDLIAASSTRRFFADGLASWLRIRDQGLCRTPFCDAPARHADHVTPAYLGGVTSVDNGQGLCEACNQAKEAPGWTATATPAHASVSGRHEVTTRTPTGHTYRSTAPPPPTPATTTTPATATAAATAAADVAPTATAAVTAPAPATAPETRTTPATRRWRRPRTSRPRTRPARTRTPASDDQAYPDRPGTTDANGTAGSR